MSVSVWKAKSGHVKPVYSTGLFTSRKCLCESAEQHTFTLQRVSVCVCVSVCLCVC